MASITRSAHSPNVEPPDGLLASFGLIPSASRARACAASSRARARVISRADPKPISVGLPCQRNRNTHRRPPFEEIDR